MILEMKSWERIREGFSEDEKTELNGAIDGQVICPAAAILDEDRMRPELKRKVLEALARLPARARR